MQCLSGLQSRREKVSSPWHTGDPTGQPGEVPGRKETRWGLVEIHQTDVGEEGEKQSPLGRKSQVQHEEKQEERVLQAREWGSALCQTGCEVSALGQPGAPGSTPPQRDLRSLAMGGTLGT